MKPAGLLRRSACLLAGLSVPAASAPAGTSICARDDVLTFIANHVRQTELHSTVVPESVGESPTPVRDEVLCTMFVRTLVYDAARTGNEPTVRLVPRSFLVRQIVNGFAVTFPE